MILFQVLICILIADFLSGFFHWLEDSYGKENWLIIGDFITKPNIIHHHNPRHFVHASWWMRNRVLFFLAVNALLIAYSSDLLNWQTLLVISIGTSANEIHRCAHQTPQENGKIIYFLQQTGILQSSFHHALHHQGQRNTHYCVITNWLNPLLEAVGLWRILEALVAKIFGIFPRSDESTYLIEL
jgi:ubiquitin-conjugating enzyme E2 variant